ncbi:MAG: hypothetical protein U1A78_04005 [Polyangia bacterium]
MRGALSGPLYALAQRERQLQTLPLLAQAAAHQRLWDAPGDGDGTPLWAAVTPPRDGQFYAPFRLVRSELRTALLDSGLCLLRGEGEGARVHPLGSEARASLWASLVPLADLLQGPIHDEEPALAVALSVARSQRQGRPLDELLALLPRELPQEPALRGAQLLRGQVIACAADVPQALRSQALESTLLLLGPEHPVPMQWRALEIAELLLAGTDAAGRSTAFAQILGELPGAVQAGAAAAAGDVPLDDFLGTLLQGGDTTELPQRYARPYRRHAATLAYLLGVLIAAEPKLLPGMQTALSLLPADAATALWPALLGGVMTHGAPPPVLEPLLLVQARSDETEARQEALRALARAQEPSEATRLSLSRGARDPIAAVRAAVAAALLPAGPWAGSLLHRLIDDPAPEVRAAAAWSLLGRGEAEPVLLSELLDDVKNGGPEARAGAAMAAAALGASDESVGEILAPLAASIQGASESEWAGLRRFTSGVWPLAAWTVHDPCRQLLYRRAVSDPLWLHALGAVLDSELGRLDDAPAELTTGLLAAAVLCLRDEAAQPRLLAARVVGAYRGSDPRVLDLMLVNEPTHEVLQVLAALCAGADTVHPQWVARLLPRLGDTAPGLLADDTPAELAMACLAELAAPDDAAVQAALARRCTDGGALGDAAHAALSRLLARGRTLRPAPVAPAAPAPTEPTPAPEPVTTTPPPPDPPAGDPPVSLALAPSPELPSSVLPDPARAS